MAEPLAVARSPTESAGDFGGQARGLILAGFLAALAGMVDAIGYLRLGHLAAASRRISAALVRRAGGTSNTSPAA